MRYAVNRFSRIFDQIGSISHIDIRRLAIRDDENELAMGSLLDDFCCRLSQCGADARRQTAAQASEPRARFVSVRLSEILDPVISNLISTVGTERMEGKGIAETLKSMR